MSPVTYRAQRGQSLIETVIVLPVFLLLVLGLLQAILFYRAKATVDYAALMAAREGATNFAQMGPMKTGLERGLMPLYTHEPTRIGAIKGFARAKADVTARGATIAIISPTQAMFDRWKETQYDGVDGIPNDSLPFRGEGKQAGVTVQDANVLKIRVTYYYPLIVPLIDRLIGEKRIALSADGKHLARRWVLPIQAQGIARMQTPIRDRSLLASAPGPGGGSGSGGSGPPGGGAGSPGGHNPPGGSGSPPGGGSPGSGAPPGGGSGGNKPPDHVCI